MSDRNEVIARVVAEYNKTARWSAFLQAKPRFSEEEKALVKELANQVRAALAETKPGEKTTFGAKKAATVFRKTFPFRSFASVRWRIRKELGKRVNFCKPKRRLA